MIQYLDMLEHVLKLGTAKPAARENLPGTLSRFGYEFRHDLANGFPLLTTKKIWFTAVVEELLWFLRGETNIKTLIDKKVHIWDQDAYNYYVAKHENTGLTIIDFKTFVDAIAMSQDIKATSRTLINAGGLHPSYILGECGYSYGKQWREWDCWSETNVCYTPIDQIENLVKRLNKSPNSRRHIVTAVDPAHDHETDVALYWCHCFFQMNARPLTVKEQKAIVTDFEKPEHALDCKVYLRSADMFLGVPFNIASYALLTHLIARMCNMVPGEMIYSFGDAHVYENHIDPAMLQLLRDPKPLPKINVLEPHIDHGTLPDHFEKYLTGRYSLSDFLKTLSKYDFRLEGYDPHPAIEGELSTGMKK